MSESTSPFKILAFDGGGIRGLFSASVVSHIEEYSQERLIDHFDLVVGTSTGAIIALGLAAGLSGSEILTFYEEHGPQIFSRKRRVGQVLRPKYSSDALSAALRDVFGDKKLNDLTAPVCIASYEIIESVPRVLKTDHQSDLHWGGDLTVWKVAAASAAAPTFFRPVTVDREDLHIDGGLWANNPVLVGLTEAMTRFNQPLCNINVLSIGTCSKPPRFTPRRFKTWGLVGWIRGNRLLETVFTAQSQSAERTVGLLLKDRHVRIDAELSSSVPLDNYRKARHLIERGSQAGRNAKTQIESRFLSDYAAYRPVEFPLRTHR